MRTLALFLLAATSVPAATHVGVGLSFGLPAPVVVHRAPPPRIVERVVAAPAPGYVWLPGHYSWSGTQWLWVQGAWVLPPRPDARWVDGVWNPQTQQWIEGHWEIPAAAPAPVVAVPSPAPTVVAPSNDIIVAEPPPPPPETDVRSPAPGPGYTWIPGYWGWENGRRQWFRGHWEQPPRGYRVWVAPRWEHRVHGYVFVRGYWM
jgi:hypothetical protein